jgi:rhodanese-related sulfurtransferase
VPSVAPQEGASLVDDGAVLLDVREPEEWSAGHAPRAIHMPLGELEASLETIDTDVRVVVVCRSGHRSSMATAFLRAMDRDAVNLDGGMQAWVKAGLSIESDGPGRPEII